MKCSLVAIVSAAGLLCLGGTPAWADPTPSPDVNWTYNFTPAQASVASNTGTGTVTFTNEPTKAATNTSDVVVTNLRVNSIAPSGTPDSFTSGGAWKVGLVLTDSGSGNSTTMTFSGKLGGTWSANNANVSNTFTGTTSYAWTDPSNGDTFKVNLVGYTPPGPPTASNAGSIAAFVQVTPGNGGGGTTAGTPEPSTLVLSFLGLGCAGLTTWQKRRRSLAAMLA
jgi:hypothetical protein